MTRVKVACTFVITVELPDHLDDGRIRFLIEDNGCPGTGVVGRTLDEHRESHEADSTCWACALSAESRVLSIERATPS